MSGILNSDRVLERAKETGDIVVFPKSNELQIDIDSIDGNNILDESSGQEDDESSEDRP